MPTTTIPAEILRRGLEEVAHEMLPEPRKGVEMSLSEVQLLPLALLSIATSLKRIADVLETINSHGLITTRGDQ